MAIASYFFKYICIPKNPHGYSTHDDNKYTTPASHPNHVASYSCMHSELLQ